MSELAKFVAATLQERVAVDLEEENEALRKKNERLEAMFEAERTKTSEYASQNGRVEITGKDGAPVYAHGEMKDSEVVDLNYFRYLDLDNPMLCQFNMLREAEIRLNGLLVATLLLSAWYRSSASRTRTRSVLNVGMMSSLSLCRSIHY